MLLEFLLGLLHLFSEFFGLSGQRGDLPGEFISSACKLLATPELFDFGSHCVDLRHELVTVVRKILELRLSVAQLAFLLGALLFLSAAHIRECCLNAVKLGLLLFDLCLSSLESRQEPLDLPEPL